MAEYQKLIHNIPPVYDAHSTILILGSFPSVKSRAQNFFYGHPQNRFWKVLAAITDCPVPQTTAQKKEFLLAHGIALWDVIAECEIIGSSDATIKNAVPNDLSRILQTAQICRIYTNGSTAHRLFLKYQQPRYEKEAIRLPSTSPANASWSLERLILAWSCITPDLEQRSL